MVNLWYFVFSERYARLEYKLRHFIEYLVELVIGMRITPCNVDSPCSRCCGDLTCSQSLHTRSATSKASFHAKGIPPSRGMKFFFYAEGARIESFLIFYKLVYSKLRNSIQSQYLVLEFVFKTLRIVSASKSSSMYYWSQA